MFATVRRQKINDYYLSWYPENIIQLKFCLNYLENVIDIRPANLEYIMGETYNLIDV